MIAGLKTIWAFGRPHTIIGSVISILTLYCIICKGHLSLHLPLLFIALTMGVCCNIFIVGINQIADVEIDRINKPHLPIAAGSLTLSQAQVIVYFCLTLSLLLSLWISPFLFYIILAADAIGWAYSMPPFHLKRHHLGAAMAIVFVRGILINIGGFVIINYKVNGTVYIPADIGILSGFIVVFSLVIAWFKDLPDVNGDAVHGIRTLALVKSPRFVFIAGNTLVALAFLATILIKYEASFDGYSPRVLVLLVGNVVLFVLFILHTGSVDLTIHTSVEKYYKRFWGFFFAEYAVFLAAYLL